MTEFVLLYSLVVLAASACVAYLVCMVRAVLRLQLDHSWLAGLKPGLRGLALRLSRLTASAQTPMEQKVSSEMLALRSTRFVRIANVMRHPLLPMVLLEIAWLFKQKDEPGEVHDIIYGEEFTAVLSMFVLYHWFASFPKTAATRLLDAAHCCIIASLLKYLYFSQSLEDYLYRHGWINTLRCSLALSIGDTSVTILVNTLFTVFDLILYSQLESMGSMDATKLYEAFPILGYCFRELATLLTISGLVCALGAQFRSEVESALEAMQLKISSHSVLHVLSSLCDAVVELDSDLSITKPSRTFCGLLLQAHEQGLQTGKQFCDFVCREDGERFLAHMSIGSHLPHSQARIVEPPPPAPLHISMRDSNGSLFPVQVFTSSFEDVTGRVTHFVGVVECGDHIRDRIDESYSSRHDAEGISMSSSLSRCSQSALHHASVTVDADSPGLRIRKSSPYFDVLRGSASRTSFLELLQEPDEFEKKLQRSVNAALNDTGPAVEAEILDAVLLVRNEAMHVKCEPRLDKSKGLSHLTLFLTFQDEALYHKLILARARGTPSVAQKIGSVNTIPL
eukprot:TRINITY_DN11764_c0_g1_i5.p1 TRINITY_DN11764_c0_g1~~TRINITY_DN11764_c0_g1_i5.p1  ORF type:complete len:627 (-),score=54.57 TRINITY_DN11764_c0_g1_i5:212-1906(-)